MAIVHIDFRVTPEGKTQYQAVRVKTLIKGDQTFRTGNPVADWESAINEILRDGNEYDLQCSSDVHDFLTRPDVNLELYTDHARAGHPFSYANYMREIKSK